MYFACNNRGYAGFSLIALLALFAACAMSCQGRGTATPIEIPSASNQGQLIVDDPTDIASIPSPLEALRGSSGDSTTPVILGAGFEVGLPNNRLNTLGDAGVYTPVIDGDKSLDESAYGIYRIEVDTYSWDRSLTTSWNAGFSNWDNLYYGLSDWESNTWDWMQTDQGQLTDPSALTPYMNPRKELLIVVLLNYGEPGSLEWLFPGSMPTHPDAKLSVSTVFGVAPLFVEFEATESTYPTGITLYEWDTDGDGVYEAQNTTGLWSTTYDEAGEFSARVRVSNELGNSDTTGRTVTVMEQPIFLSWDPTDHDWAFAWGRGDEEYPSMLNIDATRSDYTFKATDLVTGEIIPLDSLTWSFDPPDDPPVEMIAPGVIHSTAIGAVAISATDGEGNGSNLFYIEVVDHGKEPPVACFTATDTAGAYPFRVDFDHSCTTGDGQDFENMWFEWDFDGDGVTDRAHMGAYDMYGPEPSYTYHEAGDYETELVVYDWSGNWDTASTFVSVTGSGPKWHFNKLEDFISYDVASLIEVDGKPAVTLFPTEYSTDGNYYYVSAVDSLGNEWSEPTLIASNVMKGPSVPSMGVLNGVPACFYVGKLSPEQDPFLYYVEAQNPEGTVWGDPQLVAPFHPWYMSEFLVSNGQPSIVVDTFNSLDFYGYDGVSGDNGWYEVEVYSGDTQGVNAILVDGNPAVLFHHFLGGPDFQLDYVRSLDVEGKTWGNRVAVATGEWVGFETSFNIVNSFPCVTYVTRGGSETNLYFVKSIDSTGLGWDDPVLITPFAENRGYVNTWLFDIDQIPQMFITDGQDNAISSYSATDLSGDTWEPGFPVHSTGTTSSKIEIINGIPCVVFRKKINNDWNWEYHDPSPGDIIFGAYY